jgi:hypothetical protein
MIAVRSLKKKKLRIKKREKADATNAGYGLIRF